MTTIRAVLLTTAAIALLGAGCAALPAPPSPTPVPAPVTTPEDAIARVIAAEKRLTGIAPYDPNAIGQANWYEVKPASGVGAYLVTVRIGWGDCPARCINEHVWHQAVSPDGTVTVVSEAGPPVPEEAWPDPRGGRTGIRGKALAGPICPVERVPPDPACAPRPVAGAVIVVRDASGADVDRTLTGADGTYFSAVAPGAYVVEPQPVEGLLGTPGPQNVVVREGIPSTVDLAYDTGIR